MRYIYIFSIIIISLNVFAEEKHTIGITDNKTVHMVFDSQILSVDIGNQEVSYDFKDKILYLKAAYIGGFQGETNLLIQTESDEFYEFNLVFDANAKTFYHVSPSEAAWSMHPHNPLPDTIAEHETHKIISAPKAKKEEEKDEHEAIAEKLLDSGKLINDQGISTKRAKFFLDGIWVNGNKMYYKITLVNNSNIPYDIDLIRFVTRTKTGGTKKASVQEDDKQALFIANDETSTIEGKSEVSKVFVFDKFTISGSKKLYVELWEEGRDRTLEFNVRSKDVLSAKRI